ncbi:endonuclease Q family protein [Neisseria sp. Dent CA1/247]|uniref:endonuclease Q family protein n=1 Tax=Neisseria sp. Dent CA1/247 TaxID=2912675 RepID=UPI001FD41DF7|nr:endonuclease Q family protein [Neisseria sp. Dent CA1/247]UOO76061.1 endonuclease Q family protein [Neisseria sp. Dent CA1/247]
MKNPNDEYQTHCEKCGVKLNWQEELKFGWLCAGCDYEAYLACTVEIEKEEKELQNDAV